MTQKIPQLDAVRGIAILVVMVHNLNAFSFRPLSYLTTYGWAGVDLFFVLSGFLITGILIDTKGSEAYFRNFYARRCLRIWPLYYSVLLLMFVIVPLLLPHEAPELFHKSSPWWSYLFYLQNFLVAVPTNGVGPLGVTWSLAVEELFYFVWPFCVRFLSLTQLRLVAWSVILFSPPLRLFLSMHHTITYSNPFCRLDGIMAGALLALLVRQSGFQPLRFIKSAWAILCVALPLAVVAEIHSANWLTFSLFIMAFAALVFLALFSMSKWLTLFLTNRYLMFTGTISYGLYLLHKLPLDALKTMHKDSHPTLAFLIAITCAYLLAILSWNLLEKPFLRLKKFFENKAKKPAATALSLQ